MKKRRHYNKYPKEKKKEELIMSEEEFPLSVEDRITAIHKRNKKEKIKEETTVSMECLINKKWVTILYFDSSHQGRLHKHIILSIDEQDSDTTTTIGLPKRGSQEKLLWWAIKDIRNKWYYYKRGFYKRSGIKMIDI